MTTDTLEEARLFDPEPLEVALVRRRGLNRRALERRLSIAPGTLRKVFRGQDVMLSKVIMVARELGVPLEELFRENADARP